MGDNLIAAVCPGAALGFGIEILSVLENADMAADVAAGMLVRWIGEPLPSESDRRTEIAEGGCYIANDEMDPRDVSDETFLSASRKTEACRVHPPFFWTIPLYERTCGKSGRVQSTGSLSSTMRFS